MLINYKHIVNGHTSSPNSNFYTHQNYELYIGFLFMRPLNTVLEIRNHQIYKQYGFPIIWCLYFPPWRFARDSREKYACGAGESLWPARTSCIANMHESFVKKWVSVVLALCPWLPVRNLFSQSERRMCKRTSEFCENK
jgi:hypothetical protein